MAEFVRMREISSGKVYTTGNAPVEGVTEVVDRPAVDTYGRPLPPKFPTLRRVEVADEAATTEAIEEATNHDD